MASALNFFTVSIEQLEFNTEILQLNILNILNILALQPKSKIAICRIGSLIVLSYLIIFLRSSL